jgi:hypothetical protein
MKYISFQFISAHMFFFNENIVRSTEKFYRHELIFKQKFQLEISYKNKKSFSLFFQF